MPRVHRSRLILALTVFGVLASFVLLWQALLAQEERQLRDKVATASEVFEVAIKNGMREHVAALESYGEANATLMRASAVDTRLFETSLFLAIFRSFQLTAWLDPALETRWTASRKDRAFPQERISAFTAGQRAALEGARDRGEALVLSAHDLEHFEDHLFIFVPLFARDEFQGYVLGILDLHSFLDRVFIERGISDYSAIVRDGDKAIYDHDDDDADPSDQWRRRTKIQAQGQEWSLEFWPSASLVENSRTYFPLAVLGIGLFFVVLTAVVIFFQDHMAREREKSAAALRQSEERFRAITEALPVPLMITRRSDGAVLYANPEVGPLLGVPADEIVGRLMAEFCLAPCRPEDWVAMLNGRDYVRDSEVEMRTADGTRLSTIHSLQAIVYQGQPAILRAFHDITDRKEMEEQLRQSNKMEAVGQLTGGVAHDFNNLLAVIQGNIELLDERVGNDAESRDLALRAMAAAERGEALISRLLAFSRKQPLQARPTDLNELVSGMSGMLGRSVEASVAIGMSLATDHCWALVDRAQLENAVLNLALNARDAMPQGGNLTIETGNLRVGEGALSIQGDLAPGSYVTLSVSDDGLGMPPEVMERAFDPFFTTKEVGRGSGLGLSMVYGFIKQSGGHVEITSAPGQGTTVTLYLPRISEDEMALDEPRWGEAEPCGSGESILVVEDDPALRQIAVIILSNLGYRVVEAADGDSALTVLGDSPEIALLFTDVVLPGALSGVRLAEEAERKRPGLKVLFTSGYADDVEADGRSPAPHMELIEKPYQRKELARKVWAVLNG